MKQTFKTLGFMAVLCTTLAACSSVGEQLMSDGVTPYTRGELYSMLSNNTHVWNKGGGVYYADTGVAEYMAVDGTRSVGAWSTETGGGLCWHEEDEAKGAEYECMIFYHMNDDTIIVKNEASSPAPTLQEGNTLDAIEVMGMAPES